MDDSLQLTQYLYNKYDVEIMIMITLIQKKNFNEVLFWTSEYFHSGYVNELWTLITNIYFHAYALQNPYFYKYLLKKRETFHKTK